MEGEGTLIQTTWEVALLMFMEWGNPCPEYDALCPCCVAWELFDGKTVPTMEAVCLAIDAHHQHSVH